MLDILGWRNINPMMHGTSKFRVTVIIWP